MNRINNLQKYALEISIAVICLLYILFVPYYYFFVMPYAGIEVGRSDGIIIRLYAPASGLTAGDRLQQVGKVTLQQFQKDLTQPLFEHALPGETIPIVALQDEKEIKLDFVVPDITPSEVYARLQNQWVVPYIFWLAGVSVLLFLRPRNSLRLVLVAFNFTTAIWIASSVLSQFHYSGMALILRAITWLLIPVFWQLHWLFPMSLGRLPRAVWVALYLLSLTLGILEFLKIMPQNAYYMGFLLAVLGSLLLLAAHLVLQPDERHVLLGLVVALGVALLPAIIIVLLSMLGSEFLFAGAIVLGIAALPGFYFYTLYRRQFYGAQLNRVNRMLVLYLWMIGFALIFLLALLLVFSYSSIFPHTASISLLSTFSLILIALVNFAPFLILPALRDERITLVEGSRLGFSANRAASGVFFVLLLSLPVLILAALVQRLDFPGAGILSILFAVLAAFTLTLLGYTPFRCFFERRVLGMSLEPETLLQIYAGRITTSLEMDALKRLLVEEVMPSLLVRQFAQLRLDNNSLQPLFSLRVDSKLLPPQDAAPVLERSAGGYIATGDNDSALPDWVRLVIPLAAVGKTLGFWLLGQRDPDDRYSPQDIETLAALAGQTALALVNIEQADNLRALYFADINRHESERTHLAVELHDDVLNQLAVMSVSLESAGKAFLETYDRAVLHIRQIINGLRPAMLNYGLAPALESLADELNERLGDEPHVAIDLPSDPARYDPQVELHLFRIVQQACNNAIHHSACHEVHISACLVEGDAELLVSDDGRGFDAGQGLDLPALLANRHFGLAGMFERAALIGAHLHIDSQPGQGCRVGLKWPIK